ncbi:hypothetical protein KHA80_11550 [Anaerobacillus sp. HL2]|nr:hypothetical protein KHA80_11550 [Anaerobacillus sp. HL2]
MRLSKESKERIESALSFCGFNFPEQKLIINLAHLILKKVELTLILPMAIALLMRSNQLKAKTTSFALVRVSFL